MRYQQIQIVNRLLKVAFILCLLLIHLPSVSQKSAPRSIKKRTKELQKKKNKQTDENADLSEYLKKKHISNQTKQVQKRMKKSRKKADRRNNNKKEFFIIRKARNIFN